MTLRAYLHDLSLFELAHDVEAQVVTLRRIARAALEDGRGAQAVHVCRLGLARSNQPRQRAELYGVVAAVLLGRDHARAAARAYLHAAQLFALAALDERSWGARLAAAIATALSDPPSARAALLSLSRAIADTPGRGKGRWLRRVKAALCEIDLRDGLAAETLASVRAARALLALESLEDDGLWASIEGRARLLLGQHRQAEALLAGALDAFSRHDDGDRFAHLSALESYCLLCVESGDRERTLQLLSQAQRLAERVGDPLRVIRLELLRASTFIEDNPAEATRFILRAADRILAVGGRARVMTDSMPHEMIDQMIGLAAMVPRSTLAEQLREKLRG